MELMTVYFGSTGKENTDAVLNIARKRAGELGIRTILVASTRGITAVKAVEALEGFRVVVVTHVTGFRQPNVQQFTEENRKTVAGKGAAVLTTAHAFAGVSRAMHNKHQAPALGTVIADTLRTFGEGTKVACEISLMAADAGLARTDEDVISVAGTGGGADTALVVRPVNSHHFFDLKVKEVLCKPRLD